jgi:hypothetical protein
MQNLAITGKRATLSLSYEIYLKCGCIIKDAKEKILA